VGIPFLCLLSLCKGIKKRSGFRIENVLVIKIGGIGDTLLLIPILKAIKNTHEGVSLTVVCSKNNYEVLNRYQFIDNLKILEIFKVITRPFYFLEIIRDINIKKYDTVIDFEPWSRISAIVSFFIMTGYKIGFKTKGEFKHLVFDSAIRHSPLCHEIENYTSLVNAIGIQVADTRIEFPINPSEEVSVEDLLKRELSLCDNFILFHPWASGYRWYLREWGIENFISLAELLLREGYCIGITGSESDEPKARKIVKAFLGNVFSFCGKFTLGQTAYLIKKSRLLITVNTGIMHLCAALNHPMIALHGPTNVLRWGPIGLSRGCNIVSNFDCAPCLNLGFEYRCNNGRCMNDISVGVVSQKALEILNGSRQN
jgi:heptosyltransferase I